MKCTKNLFQKHGSVDKIKVFYFHVLSFFIPKNTETGEKRTGLTLNIAIVFPA